MGKLIVFEGSDRAGKTTHSQILYKKLNSKLYSSPTDPHRQIKSYINENCNDMSKFLFYLSANIELSKRIKEDIKDHDVICDRYILSTLANSTHRIENNLDFYKMIADQIIKPDYLFLLTASEEEIKKRIECNEQSYIDSILLKSDGKITQIQNEFERISKLFFENTFKINTEREINEVAEDILNKIRC